MKTNSKFKRLFAIYLATSIYKVIGITSALSTLLGILIFKGTDNEIVRISTIIMTICFGILVVYCIIRAIMLITAAIGIRRFSEKLQSHSKYISKRKNVLFICSANILRSVALAKYFSEHYPQHNFFSAGINKYFTEKKDTHYLTPEDIDKADIIVFASTPIRIYTFEKIFIPGSKIIITLNHTSLHENAEGEMLLCLQYEKEMLLYLQFAECQLKQYLS